MTVLAADFGGTTIKLGILREGQLLSSKWLSAQAERPMAERLEAIPAEWEAMPIVLGLEFKSCPPPPSRCPFSSTRTPLRVLGDFGKYPGATGIDFAAWAHDRLGFPVALENDLRAALLGESAAGGAKVHLDVVMIALGTGGGDYTVRPVRLPSDRPAATVKATVRTGSPDRTCIAGSHALA